MASNPMLVAVKGPLGCGKTTGAQYLVDKHGFVRVSFADALKVEVADSFLRYEWPQQVADRFPDFVRVYGDPDGKVPPGMPFVPQYFNNDKEKIWWVNQHKVVFREILQYWGTEYRRGQDEDYWVKKFAERADFFLHNATNVVTDDCRFLNEKLAVKNLGGFIVYVLTDDDLVKQRIEIRDGKVNKGIAGHASEADNDFNDPLIDVHVWNNDNLEGYYSRLEIALLELQTPV